MNESLLARDVGITYKIELVNAYGNVETSFEGDRFAVEAKLKSWIPTLMGGDVIRFVNRNKVEQ